jgi:uncharacterized repeat protein (TIGR01451 family)
VTINNPDNGDKKLHNVVVTPKDSGGSCPQGTTNPDCTSDVPGRAIHISKTASSAKTTPGSKITYTVTVTNTGKVAYTAGDPASFTDDLSKVLDDATYNNDASSGATFKKPTLSWSGPLAVGATVKVTYSVTVNNPDKGDRLLDNAVITPPGANANCAKGSTDPDCATRSTVKSFSVVKKASTGNAQPGSTVTYTIVVTNTGQVDYTSSRPASFSDDLSKVLDDATYNNDASNGATYKAPVLSWAGPLLVGKSVTITYSVTVNSPDTGDGNLHNAVVTPAGTGGDCPTGASNDNCATNTAVGSTPPSTGNGGSGGSGNGGSGGGSGPSGPLAFTGAPIWMELSMALFLLAAGTLLVLLANRRRRVTG